MDFIHKGISVIKEKIKNLRKLFETYEIDGYLIKTGDEYLSEYTADYAKRLKCITNFTGSNGLALILKEKAYFYTDGRYLEQSSKELDLSIFEVRDLKDLANISKDLNYKIQLNPLRCRQDEFKGEDAERTLVREHIRDPQNSLVNTLADDAVQIGYDPKLFTSKYLENFKGTKLKPTEKNLVDLIWNDQPKIPASKVYLYPIKFSGQNYLEKISLCRTHLQIHDAKYLIISKSDSICWLLDIRASDIPFSPLLLGYVVISIDEVHLFTNTKRFDNACVIEDRQDIKIVEEGALPEFLLKIKDKILVDEENTNSFLCSLIKNKHNLKDPCISLKSCKNDVEIEGFTNAHIYDAVAVCEFLAYLEKTDLQNRTEYDLAQKLTEIRSKHPQYISDSFPTICGFQGNGSIIHYNPTKDKAKKITGEGLLLIDSGAHYYGGTTDITRVLAIGSPSPKQKDFYTKVLKGHIALACVQFPEGTNGSNLDVLARCYLWNENLDYAHGTGHGVGAALSVHEGPQGINLRNTTAFKKGMVVSNEPGFYKKGEYGIRIENLMYVQHSNNNFLKFQNLTLVPYEKRLINFELLSAGELEYIKNYYEKINSLIGGLLSPDASIWLKDQTTLEEPSISSLVSLN